MPSKKIDNGESHDQPCCRGGKFHDNFGQKILMTLVGVLIVYLTFYIGTLMRNNIKKYDTIGQAAQNERTITINGTGKVTVKNDVAVTTIGYTNSAPEVGRAQADNTKVMNPVLDELKNLGIAANDIQSDFSINPQYDYTDKGSVFKGYRVTNSVTVKIRDLSKISAVLALPSKFGVNTVSGLSFTVDNLENQKGLARQRALLDAKRNALRLSVVLGVQVGEVVNYSDFESSSGAPIPYMAKAMDSAAPQVSSGSQDVMMNVSVTYKIYSGAGY